MAEDNFQRMMKIIDEVFDMRNDPSQLQVDEEVIERLNRIHPATLSEYNDGNGPAIWILLIPTTEEVMNNFLADKISEQELFELTQPGMRFDAIYLCSASTLPEYRGKGLSKKLCVEAIEKIRKDHPVKTLFVWSFTHEGELLAESVAKQVGLPLKKKTN